MNFYLIRHGQTDWNLNNRIQGQSDIPLNATGLAQAEGLVDMLHRLEITHLYVSDLVRARQTAEIANQKRKATMSFHPELREVFFGECEGLTMTEINEKWGLEYKSMDHKFPKGESKREALMRFSEFICTTLQHHKTNLPESSPAFVCHGLVIQTFINHHIPNVLDFRIDNCGVCKVFFADNSFILKT